MKHQKINNNFFSKEKFKTVLDNIKNVSRIALDDTIITTINKYKNPFILIPHLAISFFLQIWLFKSFLFSKESIFFYRRKPGFNVGNYGLFNIKEFFRSLIIITYLLSNYEIVEGELLNNFTESYKDHLNIIYREKTTRKKLFFSRIVNCFFKNFTACLINNFIPFTILYIYNSFYQKKDLSLINYCFKLFELLIIGNILTITFFTLPKEVIFNSINKKIEKAKGAKTSKISLAFLNIDKLLASFYFKVIVLRLSNLMQIRDFSEQLYIKNKQKVVGGMQLRNELDIDNNPFSIYLKLFRIDEAIFNLAKSFQDNEKFWYMRLILDLSMFVPLITLLISLFILKTDKETFLEDEILDYYPREEKKI